MAKKIEAPQWFFAWTGERGYITATVHWTRSLLIDQITRELNRPWKKIYRDGGRAIKCRIVPLKRQPTTREKP